MEYKNIKIFIIAGVILITLLFSGAIVFGIFLKNSDSLGIENASLTKTVDGKNLSANNTATSCFVALGGTVYNASPVIKKYPEYTNQILKVCGGDGSDVFIVQKYNNQDIDDLTVQKLNQELLKYKIGLLIP
ncbi:MAG: cytochrome b5 domain-containing protein [Patescibacteria group bacterium]|nr:cytochrome b5 domain-containing protein [Patescibacteria group bacterium]